MAVYRPKTKDKIEAIRFNGSNQEDIQKLVGSPVLPDSRNPGWWGIEPDRGILYFTKDDYVIKEKEGESVAFSIKPKNEFNEVYELDSE